MSTETNAMDAKVDFRSTDRYLFRDQTPVHPKVMTTVIAHGFKPNPTEAPRAEAERVGAFIVDGGLRSPPRYWLCESMSTKLGRTRYCNQHLLTLGGMISLAQGFEPTQGFNEQSRKGCDATARELLIQCAANAITDNRRIMTIDEGAASVTTTPPERRHALIAKELKRAGLDVRTIEGDTQQRFRLG
jgi:hypothetical protein